MSDTNCSTCQRAVYCNDSWPEGKCTNSDGKNPHLLTYKYSAKAAEALRQRKEEDNRDRITSITGD